MGAICHPSNQIEVSEYCCYFLGLLYSINRNNISSAPVDNQYQISTETNQTQVSVIASIQSQRNTVSVQASFSSTSISNQKIDPRIESMSSLNTEKYSTSVASHKFAAVKTPTKKIRDRPKYELVQHILKLVHRWMLL